MRRALVIGAGGQIGTDLTLRLEKDLGPENVIASDIRPIGNELLENSNKIILDVLNLDQLKTAVSENRISEVYHLAATLSATAEKNPEFAWKLNMDSLFNVLELAKAKSINKVFWPSSIAVFGPDSPKQNTPQFTIMNPTTVYGISKLAGERWCEYYHFKYGVDVRSVRFPGLLGHRSEPGGGTTDYALWALKNASENKPYVSFLSESTTLPMMHMDDAIDSIVRIMEAPKERIKIRSSYNIAGCSFSGKKLELEILKTIPNFKMDYLPDFRQEIADSWPNSLQDTEAQRDWGWKAQYDFENLTSTILSGFKKKELTET